MMMIITIIFLEDVPLKERRILLSKVRRHFLTFILSISVGMLRASFVPHVAMAKHSLLLHLAFGSSLILSIRLSVLI